MPGVHVRRDPGWFGGTPDDIVPPSSAAASGGPEAAPADEEAGAADGLGLRDGELAARHFAANPLKAAWGVYV